MTSPAEAPPGRADPAPPGDAAVLRRLAVLCDSAAAGDLRLRAALLAADPDVAALQHSINRLLDATNGFLREAGGALQAAVFGHRARRLLLRGLRGDFAVTAGRINAGIAAIRAQEREKALAEAARLRGLADAAFEGLAVCEDARVLEANASLASMLGVAPAALVGRGLAGLLALPEPELPALLRRAEQGPVQAMLAGEPPLPVELRARRLPAPGGRRHVLVARDLRERIDAEARIRHLAYHDPVTDLGNRRLLQERLAEALEQSRRSARQVAVIYLDLDRFKAVNDVHGHKAGDLLLQEAAQRLRAAVREGDTVARFGGDEFVVVMGPIDHADSAGTLAARIVQALSLPYALEAGHQGMVTASAGIALFPQDATEAEALLACADTALYRVKQAGRNGFAFFSAEMDAAALARRSLEQDLRLALPRRQLTLAWQPQAEIGGAITGFEALLRWQHPERGLIPPAEFVPLAEACGAIGAIGAWMLEQACREAAAWAVPLRVAVNVSPVQILHGDFPALVAAVLQRSGLDPRRLEMEVTEGLLLRDVPRAQQALRRLKALGLTVALDDFGTGYSSLSTLRAFPFDRLKVDRSFVADIAGSEDAAAIVRAVVGLGRSLGMPVLAEGVETEAQLTALRSLGCALVQGYLIGRPQPIGAYAPLVRQARRPL